MTDKKQTDAAGTAGWYVPLLAWLVFAVAYLAVFKTGVKPPTDVTNSKMLAYGNQYGAFAGAALGLLAAVATWLAHGLVRWFTRQRRLVALVLSALAYGALALFGYDLVYVEPRYAEVARAIITFAGKPLLYAATLTAGLALLGSIGCAVRLALVRRAK